MHIGLNDLDEEGNWMFSDGEEFEDQTYWNNFPQPQPDNGGEGPDQDCGVLYFRAYSSYMYDYECNDVRYFICEFIN